MFTDLYLRFDTPEQADAVLFKTETLPEPESPEEIDGRQRIKRYVNRALFRNTDVIGVISRPTGQMVEVDGVSVPEMAPLPGWHVNVRLLPDEDGSALAPYSVTPSAPMRVWA